MPHEWKTQSYNGNGPLTWECLNCGHVYIKQIIPDPNQRVKATLNKFGNVVDSRTDDDGNQYFHDRFAMMPYTDRLMSCEEIMACKIMNG